MSAATAAFLGSCRRMRATVAPPTTVNRACRERRNLIKLRTLAPATLASATGHVWTAPGWQEFFSRVQQWSEQPCVRPVSAVHVTAGHNALRGSGPGQNHAFDHALARVGCPDRRIDRLCITCCSPLPTVHITPDAGAISFMPRVRQVPYSARPSSSSPRPCERSCWRARRRRPWLAAAQATPRAMVDVWCRGAWHSGSRQARRS